MCFHWFILEFWMVWSGHRSCFQIEISFAQVTTVGGTRVFTDFSQIPHQWWGQSLQTSVFTSHWQTAPALLLHSCSVPFEVYHHVTAAWHTAQDAEELKYSNTSHFMSTRKHEIKNYVFNLSCQRPLGFVNKDASISYVRIYLIYAVVL